MKQIFTETPTHFDNALRHTKGHDHPSSATVDRARECEAGFAASDAELSARPLARLFRELLAKSDAILSRRDGAAYDADDADDADDAARCQLPGLYRSHRPELELDVIPAKHLRRFELFKTDLASYLQIGSFVWHVILLDSR